MRTFSTILVSLLLCGCDSKPPVQSGDFAAFFVQEVARQGGHTRGTNTIPKLQANWRMQSDTNGFEIHLTGARFPEIESLLKQAYGEPVFVQTNAVGQPAGLYKALDIGVAIQFVGEKDGVMIICLKGIKDVGEVFKRLMKP